MDLRQAAEGRIRKRKATDSHHQATDQLHRVSKRLHLLNLSQSPLSSPFPQQRAPSSLAELNNGKKLDLPATDALSTTTTTGPKPRSPRRIPPPDADSMMQLDNTPHKVYIYNLDDELSDSDSSSDGDRVHFLPNVDRHLRTSRIPPSVLANSEGELAGRNLHTDLVLYNVPSSLSVPEGQDSVRKAIIEARARAREKQRRDQEKARTAYTDISNGVTGIKQAVGLVPARDGPEVELDETMDDPDAMDID